MSDPITELATEVALLTAEVRLLRADVTAVMSALRRPSPHLAAPASVDSDATMSESVAASSVEAERVHTTVGVDWGHYSTGVVSRSAGPVPRNVNSYARSCKACGDSFFTNYGNTKFCRKLPCLTAILTSWQLVTASKNISAGRPILTNIRLSSRQRSEVVTSGTQGAVQP